MNEEHDETPLAASTGTSVQSKPAPSAAAPERKTLADWAKAKGCDPSSPGDDKHFYAGALARWRFVDSHEVTEADFDQAIADAKNIRIGNWPHPEAPKSEVR